jgi:hypothetical protein
MRSASVNFTRHSVFPLGDFRNRKKYTSPIPPSFWRVRICSFGKEYRDMNSKKLIFKLAVLALGLATLRVAATPAKATPICAFNLCSAGGGGHCGYAPREECGVCYQDDGSEVPDPEECGGL